MRLVPRREKSFGMTDVESVVHEVNHDTGARWQSERPLAGGQHSGAWEVVAGNYHAVLKWSPWTWWAPRVLNAAPVVAFARQKGYPTPAWLAWGTTREGYPYVVYDYLEGGPPPVLGAAQAMAYIDLVQRQVGMCPPTAVDWSGYITGSLLQDSEGDQARLTRLGGAAETVVVAVQDVVAGLSKDVTLPTSDLVHGDLSPGNLIFRDGVFRGVVDIEAVGSGTAAHDLMAGLRTAYLWPGEAEDGVATVLERAALDMFDANVIIVCVASQVIEILNFVLRRWPDRVEPAAARARPGSPPHASWSGAEARPSNSLGFPYWASRAPPRT